MGEAAIHVSSARACFAGAAPSADGTSSSRTYFIGFAKRAKEVTSIPIMLTGGFQTRNHAVKALVSGSADAIGLARAMVLNPLPANDWLSDGGDDPEFPM